MSDWYDNYRKKIDAEAANVKPADEIAQNVLHMKDVGTAAFDDSIHCTMFTGDVEGTMRFGFTESMVNQLMQYAYDCGTRDIDKKSYDAGFHACWEDTKNRLGLIDPEDCPECN
jgi:hypothetical protein